MRKFDYVGVKQNDGSFSKEKGYANAQIPEYQTKGAAGADFFAAEDVTINPLMQGGGVVLVHTGIKAQMEKNEVLYLYNRSSNPKKRGLVLANSVGVIDSDYFSNPDNDGEIAFAFFNVGNEPVQIKAGERIGQGVFQEFLYPMENLRVKDADREGGFGSTNKEEEQNEIEM